MAPADLTPRQVLVAQLIARGHTNREIAAGLRISHSSAKKYVLQLRTTWQCRTRTEVAVIALRTGIAPLSDEPFGAIVTPIAAANRKRAFRPIDGSRTGTILRQSS